MYTYIKRIDFNHKTQQTAIRLKYNNKKGHIIQTASIHSSSYILYLHGSFERVAWESHGRVGYKTWRYRRCTSARTIYTTICVYTYEYEYKGETRARYFRSGAIPGEAFPGKSRGESRRVFPS